MVIPYQVQFVLSQLLVVGPALSRLLVVGPVLSWLVVDSGGVLRADRGVVKLSAGLLRGDRGVVKLSE